MEKSYTRGMITLWKKFYIQKTIFHDGFQIMWVITASLQNR
jgi:hypothetical protein